MEPLVSIVIVQYNKHQLLKDCLDSIYKHCQGFNFEIIVVDNSDNPFLVQNDVNRNISIIYNEKNFGFAKANNIGAAQARGDYLFLLNNDTLFLENSLEIMYRYMVYNHDIGILGPQLLNKDSSIQYYGSLLGRYQYKTEKPREVSFLSGAAMFIKKDLFLNVGGFDERYFFYNEDVDLCKTILKKKKNLIYFPETKIIHLDGQSTPKSKYLKKQALKSSWYFFKKHYF